MRSIRNTAINGKTSQIKMGIPHDQMVEVNDFHTNKKKSETIRKQRHKKMRKKKKRIMYENMGFK